MTLCVCPWLYELLLSHLGDLDRGGWIFLLDRTDAGALTNDISFHVHI